MKTFHVTVAKVDEALYNGEAISVYVPGAIGDMEVLANHEPLISFLRAGTIRVKKSDETLSFDIDGGTIEISNSQATILL